MKRPVLKRPVLKRIAIVAAVVAALFAISHVGMRAVTGRALPHWALVLPLMVVGADIGWLLTRRALRPRRQA